MTDGAARRDRTCLVLLVEQVLSLDSQRRVERAAYCVGDARTHVARRPWITRESNTVRTPYQRVQGDQPVVIRSRVVSLISRAERESNPHTRFCRPRSSSENRLECDDRGASRGNRTLIISLED